MTAIRLQTIVLAGVLTLGLGACEKQPVGPAGAAKPPAAGQAAGPERVRLDLYVMSMCPYGVQAENALGPVVEKLGPALDLRVEFIAGEENGKLVSLHDEPEVKGDIAQLCAIKHAPDRAYRMILCQNKTPRAIPDNWEECAKETGIDVAKMKQCYTTSEGQDLLRVSAKRAAAAKAEGSPTIHIAGKAYEGRRKGADILRAVCAEYQTKPAACAEIKPTATINVTLLSDTRCKPCGNIEKILPQLKGVFPGLKHTLVDYGTPEGKKLYTASGVKFLPAVLFDASLDADPEGKQEMKQYLKPAGSYQQLMIGAKFDPTGEICDNGKDDNGDGKVDCADPQCKEQLLCRAETKKRLDVFVMSQCPYGVRALDAMKEVLKNFAGQGVTFGVHYIATAMPDGRFRSLHGQPEVDENIRAVCAIKHYGANQKYLDYIWCRNPNVADADWKPCAKNGIDPKVIEACSTGAEGKKLLADNIKLAEALGVDASPSWLANNKFPFSGIDAETIKKNLCKRNAGLKGCEKTLSGPPAEGPGAGGGGSCGN